MESVLRIQIWGLGSGAFLTPGSRSGTKFFLDAVSRIPNPYFWNLIWDPRFGSRDGKKSGSGIRWKHLGSATLVGMVNKPSHATVPFLIIYLPRIHLLPYLGMASSMLFQSRKWTSNPSTGRWSSGCRMMLATRSGSPLRYGQPPRWSRSNIELLRSLLCASDFLYKKTQVRPAVWKAIDPYSIMIYEFSIFEENIMVYVYFLNRVSYLKDVEFC